MKQNNKTNLTVIALILVVAAGAGGFFAGMRYQQTKRSSAFLQPGNGQNRPGGMMRTGNGVTRNGFRPVAGEIIKSDDTSIIVKLADGSSKIVLVTEKTEIRKTDFGAKSDLATGVQVAVFGSENTDGSVTAQNVQINPQRMGINAPTPTATQ